MTKEKEYKLTIKQEAFARAYVETGNASEAYRRAYNAENMKQESIAVNASKTLAHANVALMVQQLKDKATERHEITVDSLVNELEEARLAALGAENPQSAAAVAATMGKAKILGFIVEKNEHTGKNGGPIQTQEVRDMSDAELDAELARYGIKS